MLHLTSGDSCEKIEQMQLSVNMCVYVYVCVCTLLYTKIMQQLEISIC